MSRSSTTILIIDPTLINQHKKLMDLLIPDELLVLWMQATLKPNTLGTLNSYLIVLKAKPRQLLKFCSVVISNHVSLFQLKELDLLLVTNIRMKLLLKEHSLEILPSDLNTCSFEPLTSIIPSILRFLSQYMSTKQDLLRV